jgi:quercetin 2,3-dioxygenase
VEESFPVVSMLRGVDRITEKIPAGKDSLTLSGDWFSRPGFDWHPHRGVETVTVVVDGVNLPATLKMTPTRYQDLRGEDPPLYTRPGVLRQMMSWGAAADPGVLADAPQVLALVLRLEPGIAYSQVLPADHRAFAYVLAGESPLRQARRSS